MDFRKTETFPGWEFIEKFDSSSPSSTYGNSCRQEVEFIEKLNLRDNLWLQSTWVGVGCMAKFVVDDDDDDTDCEFQ